MKNSILSEKTKSLVELSKKFNINYQTLYSRINKHNWSIEKSINTPIELEKKGKELLGKKFGRLLVLNKAVSKNYRKRWGCICDCGNYKEVTGSNLIGNLTISCGCAQKDIKFRHPKFQASINSLISSYKQCAKKRNLTWEIDRDLFIKLTSSNCFYCNIEPKQVIKIHQEKFNGAYIYNGLDRMNNKLGYTTENVVPCCKKCNSAKMEMDFNDFIEHIFKIYNNFKNKS